jgi:hypothetical protein
MTACNKENSDYLPKANGKPGEIVLIVDSMEWKGPLGTELRNIFHATVPGLPRMNRCSLRSTSIRKGI